MIRKVIVAAIASLAMMSAVSATNYTASTAAEVLSNVTKLVAGDSLILANDTYTFGSSDRVIINQSGEAGNRIFFGTKGTDRAYFDFSAHALADANQGVILHGNWWHIRGIDIFNAGDNGMLIEDTLLLVWGGSNKAKTWPDSMSFKHACYNKLEWCRFIQNRDAGVQLKNGASYDSLINCDSYYNYDAATSGGNADGFSPKMNPGPGLYFYGCRSWHNSDDGWDSYIKAYDRGVSPTVADVTCDYCITFRNGTSKPGEANGNGNGFKMGGYKDGSDDASVAKINYLLRHCLAYANGGSGSGNKGFDANRNEGAMKMYNCSAGANVANEFAVATGTVEVKNSNAIGGSSEIDVNCTPVTSLWTVTASDFESTDTTVLVLDRNSDGSLPAKTLTFMKPKSTNTTCIDQGTNLSGMTYSGSKADIGWIEVGLDITGVKGMNISRPTTSAGQLVTAVSTVKNGIIKVDLTCLPSGKLEVALFDVSGKKVMNLSNNFGAANKSQIIDMSKLAAGSYVCNFKFSGASDGVKTDNLKLVKE